MWFKKIGSRRPEEDGSPKLKLHKKRETQARGQRTSTTLTAQPPKGKKWISVKKEKPPYYLPIDLWDGKYQYIQYHRVSQGDYEYYANMNNDRIVYHITHWSPPSTYTKYDPMDTKIYSREYLKDIIREMEGLIINKEKGIDPVARLTYNSGVQECIKILKKRL